MRPLFPTGTVTLERSAVTGDADIDAGRVETAGARLRRLAA